jgi:hypothetical protein
MDPVLTVKLHSMSTIKELLPKPSDAVQAMIGGLKEYDADPNFSICMKSYGNSDASGVCFGCAATCTIQHVFKYAFTPWQIKSTLRRAAAVNSDYSALNKFEFMINGLRSGDLHSLLYYYGINIYCSLELSELCNEWDALRHLYALSTHNWRERLPRWDRLVARLKFHNL